MSGLDLVGGVHRIDQPHVVTAAVPGVSDGRLAQLFMEPWDPAVGHENLIRVSGSG